MESNQSAFRTTDKISTWLYFGLAVGVLIFLVGLPIHLVIKKFIPDPIGTYWKEILLMILVGVWAALCVRQRKLLITHTSLDIAVVVYLGLLILRFIVDRSGWTGAWGLYASVMYLPIFWIIPVTLKRYPEWANRLLITLVIIGALLALGGLIEFAIDKPLWPSQELMDRYGSYDAYIYGTRLRRVYFTFDSPTALANTLAMLLPLSIALVLTVRALKWRILAGLSALLIAGGIVVTFSRGIWVASIISLLVMGILGMLKLPNRRVWLTVAGVIIVIAVVGGFVAVTRSSEPAPAYERVVELTPTVYQNAPIVSVVDELLEKAPDYGEVEYQTWSLIDHITQLPDEREVIFEHPRETTREEIIYQLSIPANGAIAFAITLSPEVWSPEKGDGVNFQLYVTEPGNSDGKFVFNRYINPKLNINDRRWLNFIVDLSPWAGKVVNLSFITESGTSQDYNFDWAGWADPKIITIDPRFYTDHVPEGQNIVVKYARSILDWARDQSNQDRLIAWNRALNSWKRSPVWGTGLGTTGIASLRTNPEEGYVTESQALKSLTELGIPGIIVWGYLWFEIGRNGYFVYQKAANPTRLLLLLGIIVSLIVVFIEGWVFQNLEVKQVNAYFWTLIGMLAYYRQNNYQDEPQGVSED